MTNIQAYRKQSTERAEKLARIAKVVTDAPERAECDFGYATPTEPAKFEDGWKIDLREYMAGVSGDIRRIAHDFYHTSPIAIRLEDLADQIDTVLEAGAK